MQTNIIKFLTAGNVDDGKSTLIGRMLYDTDSLLQDQIEEAKSLTKDDFEGEIDFSFLLDGLLSERKQKITIDVAYRHFNYQDSKFIIADAPGHEQYTRNMAVAAANSDAVILLVDATKGITTQTIRHSNIANLFGIKNAIIAVNKMDLVNYDKNIFNKIKEEYLQQLNNLDFVNINFVPISAINGENIVNKSKNTPWFKENSIIEHLLKFRKLQKANQNTRLLVQNIFKHNNKRLYQGTVLSGEINIGNKLKNITQNQYLTITELLVAGNSQQKAKNGDSISFFIDENIDFERGDLIAKNDKDYIFSDQLKANIIWFSDQDFNIEPSKEILVKINHCYLNAKITSINNKIDFANFKQNKSKITENNTVKINEIANIDLAISQKIAFDKFVTNKNSGSLLLIDKITNETLAGGVILY